MNDDIFVLLEELGLKCDICPDKDTFQKIIAVDVVSLEFANLIHWLSIQLRELCDLEECVGKVKDSKDLDSFYMELNSFLREIYCPYLSIIDNPLSKRLQSRQQKNLLAEYLAREILAASMIKCRTDTGAHTKSSMQLAESDTSAGLRTMLTSLGFPKPPANITPNQLFSKVINKAKENLARLPKYSFPDSLFTGTLSEKQWQTLKKINESMTNEYKVREDVLLKRIDVTMQSFTWSERIKKFEEKLHEIYQPARLNLKIKSRIQLADLLAARADLLDFDKTSGVSVRAKTKSKINAVVLRGKVPDRGGRPTEIEPPPPEMPAWKQRSQEGGGGYAPQGQRQHQNPSRGGGSRVQSSWNATDNWRNQGKGAAHGYSQGGASRGGYCNTKEQYGGQQQSNAYYGQQQGAAHYQDYYGADASRSATVGSGNGQQQDGYNRGRGSGGGRGGSGRRAY